MHLRSQADRRLIGNKNNILLLLIIMVIIIIIITILISIGNSMICSDIWHKCHE